MPLSGNKNRSLLLGCKKGPRDILTTAQLRAAGKSQTYNFIRQFGKRAEIINKLRGKKRGTKRSETKKVDR